MGCGGIKRGGEKLSGSGSGFGGHHQRLIHSFHAVVDAIAHIDVKPPWLTKERLVAGGAAAVAVAGGVVLAFHQPAANQRRGNALRGTAEEGVGQGWVSMGATDR